MDYKINIEPGTGLGIKTFEPVEDITNNIYLSLKIKKGSFFQNPTFGSRLYELDRAKNTAGTAALAEEYAKESLQWLIDTGRALSVAVTTEREQYRLKLLVEVTQTDGRQVTFEIYLEVI